MILTEIVIDDAQLKKDMEELQGIVNQLEEKVYQLRKNAKVKVRLTSEEPLKEEATSGNW